MTIHLFFQNLRDALEWAVNSEFVFAVVSAVFCIFVLLPVFCSFARFVIDEFIFDRRSSDE